MYNSMATYVPKNITVKPGECTEFQLHKSQLTIFNNILRKIYDYSEYKLRWYIQDVQDATRRLVLQELLKEYVRGKVAVAWKNGDPIWIKVTKD